MTLSKQFISGFLVGAFFLLLTHLAISSVNTPSSSSSSSSSASSFSSSSSDRTSVPSTISSSASPLIDQDVLLAYCRKHYTPDAYFHLAFHALHKYQRSILFLDIGGHEGHTTFPAIACAPVHHRVFTVEPVQRNLNIILGTAETLGISEPSYMWTLLRGALSNETREATIYVPTGREDNAALDKVTSTANVGGEATAQAVKMFKGDDLIYDKGLRPELIKIDVQGLELLVMHGMTKLLSEERNMVVVSEYDSKLMWANLITTMDPYDYMISLGFKAYCAPVLKLDAKGAIVANNSDDEISREKMASTTDPVDTSKCGDITYIKNIN